MGIRRTRAGGGPAPRIAWVAVLIAFTVIGCAERVKTVRQFAKHDLAGQTNYLEVSEEFHCLVRGTCPPEPFRSSTFIIGIEKADFDKVGHSRTQPAALPAAYRHHLCHPSLQGDAARHVRREIVDELTSPGIFRWLTTLGISLVRVQFPSHIVAYLGADGRFLYNAYDTSPVCTQDSPTDTHAPMEFYRRGWDALRALERDLAGEITRIGATHILVMATGWKNNQQRSLDTYRALDDAMRTAADRDGQRFEPIVIGFTWPSQWGGIVGRAVVPDFLNKINDAEELGLIWASIVLNDVVLQMKSASGVPKVVLVGHSFGARALSRAAYSMKFLPPAASKPATIDLLIGLQAALPVDRYVDLTHPYVVHRKDVTHTVYTTSQHDLALPLAGLWGQTYVGAGGVYGYVAAKTESGFVHARVDAEGYFVGTVADDDRTRPASCPNVCAADAITLVNADDLFPGHALPESPQAVEALGRFIWETIKRCAP